jgi:hypothetical protein
MGSAFYSGFQLGTTVNIGGGFTEHLSARRVIKQFEFPSVLRRIAKHGLQCPLSIARGN